MYQHTARKRFGQNFLINPHIINGLIESIRPKKDDIIIEIGPGLAALTKPLSSRVDFLHVIEIDRDIVKFLKNQPFEKQLCIHHTDVLQFDFRKILGQKKIVGNLPYNISTPLLFKLINYIDEVIEMHFMLQKEVVERMIAQENSKDYGRLSVILQYYFEMEKIIDVPASSFDPAPKVESAFIRLIPKKEREIPLLNEFFFCEVVKKSFAMRRKTISNNLKKEINREQLIYLDIDPGARPENLTLTDYIRLSNYLVAVDTKNNYSIKV